MTPHEIALLASLALLLYRGVTAVRVAPVRLPAVSPAEGAALVARERLIRGELDRDEYDRIVRVLTS